MVDWETQTVLYTWAVVRSVSMGHPVASQAQATCIGIQNEAVVLAAKSPASWNPQVVQCLIHTGHKEILGVTVVQTLSCCAEQVRTKLAVRSPEVVVVEERPRETVTEVWPAGFAV